MSEERLISRISAANPVPHLGVREDRDAIFTRIISQPAHQSPVSNRRFRAAMPRLNSVRTWAVGTAVGAAAIAVAIAGSGAPTTFSADGVNVSGAHMQETAYIVRAVRKDLAAVSSGSGVLETSSTYAPGTSNAQQSISWTWTSPGSGIEYERTTTTNAAGDPVWATWSEIQGVTHDQNGQVTESGQSLTLDYGAHTYTQGPMTLTYTPSTDQIPSLLSTTTEITQALQAGSVSQAGTTTVDGTPVIALSVTGEVGMTLYVNAQSYQPMRMVLSNPVNSDNEPITTDLDPATTVNIANTDAPSIPSGFTAASTDPKQTGPSS